MPAVRRILVVDDSRTDRRLVGGLLGDVKEWTVSTAEDGAAGLRAIEKEPPDLVLTDLRMPGMDGLELVGAIRSRFPALPVILMTSQGSEEIAVKALRAGAASYVPKAALGPDLVDTIGEVLALAAEHGREEALFERLQRAEAEFRIENDMGLVRPLVRHVTRSLGQVGWGDEAVRTQVAVALCEAVQNAIEHGNLEVGSEARAQGLDRYYALLEERRLIAPYRERRVHVEARLERDRARFVVRDEGPGFDHAALPDPRDPANLERLSGRGVLLIRTFMDEVTYDGDGSRVTMVKRRPQES